MKINKNTWVLLNEATAKYQDFQSRLAAKKALKTIELQSRPLSKNYLKITNEYAKDVFGSKKYAPWLQVYTAISGEFKEGWMPDNYFRARVVPKIQGGHGKLSFLKTLNHRFFPDLATEDLAYFVNGHWFGVEEGKQLSRERLIRLINLNSPHKIVFKLDNSLQGKDVHILKSESAVNRITELEKMGNGIIQRFVVPHSFFNVFQTFSVPSIRLTTVINKIGVSEVRSSYLRLGRKDDLFVQSQSHIRVAIDVESGRLSGKGFMPCWKSVDSYPDNDEKFEGYKLPEFNKCKQLVIDQHNSMPFVKAIGWDLIVDEENKIVVFEWNGYGNDIKFSEATQGPCFSDLMVDTI